MLKRSPLDDDLEDGPDGAPGGTILVLNHERDAGELVARLVESVGHPALRFTEQDALVGQLAEGGVRAVIIDALGTGISSAFEVLSAIRNGPPATADTPVMILAASDTNRLYAYQQGVDAYLVRPFHGDDLLDAVAEMLARPPEAREPFRQAQLAAGGS